jgi:hypothetical protein
VLYTYLDAWGAKAKAWFTRSAPAQTSVSKETNPVHTGAD